MGKWRREVNKRWRKRKFQKSWGRKWPLCVICSSSLLKQGHPEQAYHLCSAQVFPDVTRWNLLCSISYPFHPLPLVLALDTTTTTLNAGKALWHLSMYFLIHQTVIWLVLCCLKKTCASPLTIAVNLDLKNSTRVRYWGIFLPRSGVNIQLTKSTLMF